MHRASRSPSEATWWASPEGHKCFQTPAEHLVPKATRPEATRVLWGDDRN